MNNECITGYANIAAHTLTRGNAATAETPLPHIGIKKRLIKKNFIVAQQETRPGAAVITMYDIGAEGEYIAAPRGGYWS